MGWGLFALSFGSDQIRTLVSMSTDSSYRVIMGKKLVTTLANSFLISSFLFLQVTRPTIKSRMGSNLARLWTKEL